MNFLPDDGTLVYLDDDELTVIIQALGDYNGPYGRSPEETTLNKTEVAYYNKCMKIAEEMSEKIDEILTYHYRRDRAHF